MATVKRQPTRRASITLLIVGLLAMLFVLVSAYITLARFDRVTILQYDRAQDVDQAIDSINDLIRSMMREQFVDAEGEFFGGAAMKDTTGNGTPDTYVGLQFEDVPGHGKSRFGGGLEPFYDFVAGPANEFPLNYRRFVSSTGTQDGTESWSWPPAAGIPDPPPGVSIRDMVKSQSFSETASIARVLFGGSDTAGDADDWAQLARRPFMDADGDGVPDASFEHTGNLQELVNAIFGRMVRAPTGNEPVAGLEPLWRQMWQRYHLSARFEVAVRVVPHSGMVALDSYNPPLRSNDPATRLPFNRFFVREMFEWVRADNRNVPRAGNSFYDEIHLNRRAIEPILRRRGMLASWRDRNDSARIPEFLREDMEGDYPNTFVSGFGRGPNGAVSQRFNIATDSNGGEGIADWGYAMRLAPPNASSTNWQPDPTALENYDRRHLITTASTSDELARVQEAPDDDLLLTGIERGQLKFYLGKIMRGNDTVAPVFSANGVFDPVAGGTQIFEIANLFYTMLQGHLFGDEAAEASTTRAQALMLAVNTVAFAAPRNPLTGFIDTVYFDDNSATSIVARYVGYTPQPFITQVMIHDNQNGANPWNNDHVALGLELYNPNEPTGLVDAHALDLSQFAISFDGTDPNVDPQGATWELLAPDGGRMRGRSTYTLAIHGNANNPIFDDVANAVIDTIKVPAFDSAVDPVTLAPVKIQLWRANSAIPRWWVVVDELTVDLTANWSTAPNLGDGKKWFMSTYRDMTDDGHFRPADGGKRARWGAAVGMDLTTAAVDEEPGGSEGIPDFNEIIDIDEPTPSTRFAPAPPLYTMNAGYDPATPLLMHIGDGRPVSFPTPGFMLFVPRFSHVVTASTVNITRTPATAVLKKQWIKQTANNSGIDITNHNYPADFGHMPIFDNNQTGSDTSLFNQPLGAGKLPWGLLVFDYFTTIDPQRIPGGDPLRVPGRININAAPWYVLAGLPVIKPAGNQGRLDLPFAPQLDPSQVPSPAFWDNDAGILVGNATAPLPPRFDIAALAGGESVDDVWYRLGAKLALEAVSYRDRAAYVDPTGFSPASLAPSSYNRNAAVDPNFSFLAQYRNEFTYGALRREGTGDSKKYGFVSIGELLNVKGFDTAVKFDGEPGSASETSLSLSEVLHYDTEFGTGPDFMKAVSLMALLETQFLTTRGNTFTVYVSVFDRENPQASVRSQITVDRGNTLPKLSIWRNPATGLDELVPLPSSALPEIIAERRIGYFNTAFDD